MKSKFAIPIAAESQLAGAPERTRPVCLDLDLDLDLDLNLDLSLDLSLSLPNSPPILHHPNNLIDLKQKLLVFVEVSFGCCRIKVAYRLTIK